MLRTNYRIVIPLLACVLGCTGSPTDPEPLIAVQFLAAPSIQGSFSLSLEGVTYTSPALQTVFLHPGTYEASGTATGSSNFGTEMLVGFSGGGTTIGQGGVESGSIVSVTGPVLAITSGCGIGYFRQDAGPYQFRFRFTITADPAKAC